MFSRELIQYTESTFKEQNIEVLDQDDGEMHRDVVCITAQVATQQGRYLARLLSRLAAKEELEKKLAKLRAERSSLPEGPKGKDTNNAGEIESIVKQLNKSSKIGPFHYSHQGSLAYIGLDKAIADLPFLNANVPSLPWFASGGVATFLFWRTAYLSSLFSLRDRMLMISDWLKVKLFGRDVSHQSRN
ncbi:NADH:ubiquinone oxidoreductase [Tulasnella sp. 417]|nr:NADH:ubiquinone oxidoreductase [Tulasnella sp. 417]